MSDDSFPDLIRRVRGGDQDAAAELVRRFEPAIRRAVRVRLVDDRLRRQFDTMDVCQSVLASFFVRVAMGQFELDRSEQLLKPLATMVRNKVAERANQARAGRRDYRRAGGSKRRPRWPGPRRPRAGCWRPANCWPRPGGGWPTTSGSCWT